MANHISVPAGGENNGSAIQGSTGSPAQGGAVYPPYFIEAKVEAGKIKFRDLLSGNPNAPWIEYANAIPNSPDNFASLRAIYGADRVFPPLPAPASGTATATSNEPAAAGDADVEKAPYDPRLIFIRGEDSKGASHLLYSFTARDEVQTPLVDGHIIADPEDPNEGLVGSKAMSNPEDPKRKNFLNKHTFYGVPSLMNDNMYISLMAAGGKIGNQFLRDIENKPKFYDVTSRTPRSNADGSPVSATAQLTVKDIIDWSGEPGNLKFPYRFQDFVFCKWWKKIPLNYMVTLRRYTRPVIDNVSTEFDQEFMSTAAKEKSLADAAHAITFLGEDTGNKISTILGPIDVGLKWKDIKSAVHDIQAGSGGGGNSGSADTPLPGIAKLFAFLQGGVKKSTGGGGGGGGTPQDPYNNGPYANKIIGPVTVIDSTKARDRGILFKHAIKLTFEYSARAVGGINPKAALLDILGNMMILTFNEASFWGGVNRHMPGGGGGGGGESDAAPFLGGKEGKKAWINGDPEGFFKSVTNQFNSVMSTVGDFFKELAGDPVSTLMGAGSAAMSNFMKGNGTSGAGGGGGQAQQLHALLTGDPIGEWHVTVGNPMNPMMMIGNLICTNMTITFNDELGPDDFPTEVKFEITLDHGMPRDRAAVEGMFNKGSGRIYSFPPGVRENEKFSTYDQSAVDAATGGKGTVSANANDPAVAGLKPGQTRARNGNGASYSGSRGGKLSHLIGDPNMWSRSFNYAVQTLAPSVSVAKTGFIANGFAFMQSSTKTL